MQGWGGTCWDGMGDAGMGWVMLGCCGVGMGWGM